MHRRRGRSLNGVLVLDKPAGFSSNTVLQQVRAIMQAAKAGHTGSLDPAATGVLPLCFGEATKFAQFLLDSDKKYQCTVAFGSRTATGDADGEILCRSDASRLQRHDVERVLQDFRGAIEQVPPMYSAVKVNGQPLYKLARRGIEVEREKRPVTVHRLALADFRPGIAAQADLEICCSKGTYVRTLADDIGQVLKVGGHLCALRRTHVGPYTQRQATSLAFLQEMKNTQSYRKMDELLQPLDSAVSHLPKVMLPTAGGFYLRQGQAVRPKVESDGLVRVYLENGEFIGVGEVLEDRRLVPRRLVAA